MSGQRLISVRSELVKETLVERLCDGVLARLRGDLPEAVAELFDGERGRSRLSASVARAGYFARVVESQLFEPARLHMPGLAESVRARSDRGSPWPEAVETVAWDLASREPLERPAPDDPNAVSWRVPGPGGHVRHYVARRLITGRLPLGHLRPVDETRQAALKRDFMYGFLVRCCEETLPPS